MKIAFFLPLVFFLSSGLSAQPDSLFSILPDHFKADLIEEFTSHNEEALPFNDYAVFEQLEALEQNPLDLNKAGESELRQLIFMSDLQIAQLLAYREKYGHFLALEELQAVPGLSLEMIRLLLPYIRIGTSQNSALPNLRKMISEGKHAFYLRWQRKWEKSKGLEPAADSSSSPFAGGPDKWYVRYKYRYGKILSLGWTAEKDAGESFFRDGKIAGFDFYSAHLFWHREKRRIRSLAIGDFAVSFGQGLILYAGFARSKGMGVMNIKRSQSVLRPYSSVDENNFMRGVGTTINLAPSIDLTLFASLHRRDANLLPADTVDQPSGFSSLQYSGLHRSQEEISEKDAVRQRLLGGTLVFHTNKLRLAFNSVSTRLDKPWIRHAKVYNQFYFSGLRLINCSFDYSVLFKSVHFFGETAMDDRGSIATTNGLLLALDRRVDLSLLFRRFPNAYRALHAQPLAETSGANNETGLYIGTVLRFNHRWSLQGYLDLWRHPWLRFGVDAPSRGYEYRVRLNYVVKKKLRLYLEWNYSSREKNEWAEAAKMASLVPTRLMRGRLQINQHLTKELELRSRIDLGSFEKGSGAVPFKGMALYQDVLFRPLSFPLWCTARISLFDTDGYNMRFYAYENDLLNAHSVPAYFNRGYRYYINLRYKATKNLTLELRFSRTHWLDRERDVTGPDPIELKHRTELKGQIKLSF